MQARAFHMTLEISPFFENFLCIFKGFWSCRMRSGVNELASLKKKCCLRLVSASGLQPPLQWVQGSFAGGKAAGGMTLTTHSISC